MEQVIGTAEQVSPRAAAGKSRLRRLRVVRNLVPLLLMAVGLCTLVIWQRNWIRLNQAQENFEAHLPGLIQAYRSSGMLPLVYPPPDGSSPSNPDFEYIDGKVAHRLSRSPQPVVVAHSRVVRQVLRPDLQFAAMKTGDRFDVVQIEAEDLSRRLAEQRDRAALAPVTDSILP